MLTPRLDTIAKLAGGVSAADIGTDHAYIPIELIKTNRIKSAIACDVKAGPLKMAYKNIAAQKLENLIELRLGNGLEPVSAAETENVIIAGMGGLLIKRILAEEPEKSHSFKKLVLQPMNAQYELRKYLYEDGYRITCEELAVEGFKVYNVITAENGSAEIPADFECHVPPSLAGHRLFPEFKAKKIREFSKILGGLKKASEQDAGLIEYYEYLLDRLERLK